MSGNKLADLVRARIAELSGAPKSETEEEREAIAAFYACVNRVAVLAEPWKHADAIAEVRGALADLIWDDAIAAKSDPEIVDICRAIAQAGDSWPAATAWPKPEG